MTRQSLIRGVAWAVLVTLLALRALAQENPTLLNPIKWKLKTEAAALSLKPGEKFEVQLEAEIEEGWHLYATKEIPLGPRPTRITLAAGQPFELTEDIDAPPTQRAYDENFSTDLEFYEEAATFTLPLQVAAQAAAGTRKLTVQVRYQTCTEKQCLPPKLVKLDAEVEIKAAQQNIAPANKTGKDAELELLAQWMTGDFDTFAQVAADETAKTAYRHDKVILHLAPVQIKGFFDDGASKTFYLEQAQADTPAQPYRQGIYLLTRVDGKIVNRTYRIRDAAKLVGAHADPKLLKQITADQLTPVEGCEVTFAKAGDALYRGVMGEGKTCKTTRRGATYMVSHGELTPSATITLDQGFDDAGIHKWGPPPGVVGHIFVKRKP